MLRTTDSLPPTALRTPTGAYTIDAVASTSPTMALYSARDAAGNPVWIIQTSLIGLDTPVCGEDFDPESTAPLDPLVVPWRDRGEEGGRPFFVFLHPPGSPAPLAPRCTWEPHRVKLLLRLVDALRDARNRRVGLAWCTWESLFLGPQGDIRWLAPLLAPAEAPAPARKEADRVFSAPSLPCVPPGPAEGISPQAPEKGREGIRINVETLDVLRHTLPREIPASLAQDEQSFHERQGLAALLEHLGPLTRVTFAPPGSTWLATHDDLEECLDDASSQAGEASSEEPTTELKPPAGRDALSEAAPGLARVSMSTELWETLQAIRSERFSSLDEIRRVLDEFGASRPVRLRSGWGTHRGRIRESNEDALLVLEQSTVMASRPMRIVLYAVADGMGGHEAGEVASEITLKSLAVELLGGFNFTPGDGSEQDVHDADFLVETARQAIDRANHTLRAYTMELSSDARRRPGSTLVFALCVGPVVTLGHVGDSRAYRFTRSGTLQRITRDHSLVQALVDQRKITEEEAFKHPYRHQIHSNIGMPPERLRQDIATHFLKEEECLILCSDGLNDMLQDGEIEAIVRKRGIAEPRALARLLIDAACDRGGHDNVTVIVVARPPSPLQDPREGTAKIPDTSSRELP